MAYRTEITQDDIAFIQASVLGTVRRAQEAMSVPKAVNITTQAAEVITRLNAGNITVHHVMFINTCIQKTIDLLRNDGYLSKEQRLIAIQTGERIQNKLAGVGKERSILNG